MKSRNVFPWWMLSALALGAVACVCGSLGDLEQLASENSTTVDEDSSTDGQDSGDFTEIEANQSYDQTMHQTDEPYPANCQYFSIEAPEGTSLLEISLTDMDSDLDIYVQYENQLFDDEFDEDAANFWFSREAETTDEVVSISSPQAGTYYIEVYSYEGGGTPYTLTTTVR